MNNLLENNPLFKECLEALNVPLLSDQEDKEIFELFETMYPLTDWGKVDWDKIDKKIEVGYYPKKVISALEKLFLQPFDKSVYLLWDDAEIPVIKANLDDVIKKFDDVTCICFDTFIFNPKQGYIIERRHGGNITVGIVEINN